MMLRCRCGVTNYLDPYPFWNFNGRTKCAGCDTVSAVEIVGGRAVGSLVASRPLKADGLIGSRPRFIVVGREPR